MGLSTNTTTYTGGAQTFAVNFALGFITRADVFVRVNSAVDGSGDPVYTPFTWIDDSAISVTTPLTIGDTVEVLRTVSKTSLEVNFANNTDVTPANLDISAKQGLMVYQELIDGRVEGTESPIIAGNRAEAAALAAEASAAAALASEGLVDADAIAAAASAAAALASESVVTTSATNASLSEANAATSASNAATSETNTTASESAASTSASNAATSETNTATSATNAGNSASAASASASAAATSEANAATSASEAASSAASVNLASIDINGGTIDGTVIGGSVRAAGNFTSLDVTGTVSSNVSTTGNNNFNANSAGGGRYRIYPDDATTANPTWLHQSNSSEEQAWVIGGAERMRLSSAGVLTANQFVGGGAIILAGNQSDSTTYSTGSQSYQTATRFQITPSSATSKLMGWFYCQMRATGNQSDGDMGNSARAHYLNSSGSWTAISNVAQNLRTVNDTSTGIQEIAVTFPILLDQGDLDSSGDWDVAIRHHEAYDATSVIDDGRLHYMEFEP